MKVVIVGKDTSEIEKKVRNAGFEVVKENPEITISYGGDGTLLHAERQFPGIPKLPIRNSNICKKCSNHEDEVLLKDLLEGKLQLKEYQKLETTIYYKKFFALNDFVIRNIEPIHAIRFKILQNNISGWQLYIGDGIVLSTSFGSTGYFKSITGESFEKPQKWGLTFNNITEKRNPIYPGDGGQIGFKLVRGKATLSFDNSPNILTLDENSEVSFKLSDQVAKIYAAESLRCLICQINFRG